MLYVADEVFFAGTAAEITPDPVGRQDPGRRRARAGRSPSAIQQAFFDYINGVVPDRHGWLLPLDATGARPVAAAAARVQ